MAAVKIDLTIEKGATFGKIFLWKDSDKVPINLTDYTARMQIKKSNASLTNLVELTTENGGITITPIEGKIELYISDTDTSALVENKGQYDLELITPDTTIVKFVRGYVVILEEITK